MKTLILAAVFLGGCAQIQGIVPSFWDDNQSARIVDVRLSAEQFDCAKPHMPQILALKSQLRWFDLYSESKGARQQDVRAALKPLADTVEEFRVRTAVAEGSATYCRIKVQTIQTQAARVAGAVLGRF